MAPLNFGLKRDLDVKRRERWGRIRDAYPFGIMQGTRPHQPCSAAAPYIDKPVLQGNLPLLPVDGCDAIHCYCWVTIDHHWREHCPDGWSGRDDKVLDPNDPGPSAF